MRLPGRSGGTGIFVCKRLGGRERILRGLPARAAKGTCHEPGVLVGYAWMCRSRNEQLPGDARGAVAGLPPNTNVAPAYQEAGFLGGPGGWAGGEQALPDQGDSEIGEIFGSAVTQVYGPRGAVTGTNENGEHLTGLASWKYIPRCEPGKGDSAR